MNSWSEKQLGKTFHRTTWPLFRLIFLPICEYDDDDDGDGDDGDDGGSGDDEHGDGGGCGGDNSDDIAEDLSSSC